MELAKNLSYGEQRRLEIARALAADPKLLILDEPAGGHERAGDRRARRAHPQRSGRAGITVLLIEHDMSLVMRACEHIVVLEYGEKIAEGTPADDPDEPARHRGVPRHGGGLA